MKFILVVIGFICLCIGQIHNASILDKLSKANKALDLIKDLQNTNLNDQQEVANKLDQLKKNELFNEIIGSVNTEIPKSIQKSNEDSPSPNQRSLFNNFVNVINNQQPGNDPSNLNTLIQNFPSNTNDIINSLAHSNLDEIVQNSNNLLNDLTNNVNTDLNHLAQNVAPEANNFLEGLDNTDLTQIIQDLSSNPDIKLPNNLEDVNGFLNNLTAVLSQYNVTIPEDLLANLTNNEMIQSLMELYTTNVDSLGFDPEELLNMFMNSTENINIPINFNIPLDMLLNSTNGELVKFLLSALQNPLNLTREELSAYILNNLANMTDNEEIVNAIRRYLPQLMATNNSQEQIMILLNIFYPNLLTEFADLMNLVNQTFSNLNEESLMAYIVQMINESDLTEWQKNHLISFLPKLISDLSKANSMEEAWEILDPVVVHHLAYFFNDSSLLESESPYSLLASKLVLQLLLSSDLGEFTDSEELKQILTKFLRGFMETEDFQKAFMYIQEDLIRLIMEHFIDMIREAIKMYSPLVYELTKNENDFQKLSGILFQLFNQMIQDQMKRVADMFWPEGLPEIPSNSTRAPTTSTSTSTSTTRTTTTTTITTTTTTRGSTSTTTLPQINDQQLLDVINSIQNELYNNLISSLIATTKRPRVPVFPTRRPN